ncbi:MAG: HU family DNA-binding protein [Caldiserica bacterium]|nr:HU family DNA-binding protein [Caldisericota bacterium]
MNKAELVEKVAEAVCTKKEAEAAVDAMITAITDALKKGEDVRLVGFGTFQVRKRAAREGRNPRTGATLSIPAKKVPVFKAGKTLKDAVA